VVLVPALAVAIDGRRRFRGVLLGAEGEAARIRRDGAAEGEPAETLLPIGDMAEAKLVLTDALVAQALRRGKHAERETRESTRELNKNPAASGRHHQFRRALGKNRHGAIDEGE